MKPDEMSWDKAKAVETVQQLAGYMRQILCEQLDRRFVLGLILFHDSISLWYCDRSGLLGTDRVINIHEVRISSSIVFCFPFMLLLGTQTIYPYHWLYFNLIL